MTSLACQLILRVFNCFTYIPLSSYRWILFKISHAICRIFFCSLLHTIYEVDEDHDHWTSFLSVYPDNNSGRCFSLISKIIISHLVYMELWELVLYLGKDECKHSTACWGEAACCIFSLRCWISSSVPQFTYEETVNRSSHCGTVEMNPTRNHEVASSIPGLAQWVKDPALPWVVV